MSKKKTQEEFIKEVKILYNGEYSVIGNYLNSRVKIKMKHHVCHSEFEIRPDNFLHGSTCPFCAKQKLSNMKKKPFSTLKDEIYNLVDNEYIVYEDGYKNAHSKLKFIHNIDNCNKEFYMNANKFLAGNRCPHCKYIKIAKNQTKTQEQFKEDVLRVGNDEFEVIGDYKNQRTSIKIKHKKCNRVFEIKPEWFLYKHICPLCNTEKNNKAKTKTQKKFEEDIYKKFGDDYSVVGKYINTQTPILIKHNKCNQVFCIKPIIILSQNRKCPICNGNSNGELIIKTYLDAYNIKYESHKTFSDLFGLGKGKLSFDFYIPSHNTLIEFQGIQHQKPIKFFGGIDGFKKQIEHDKIKETYAKLHDINFIALWYYDMDNIDTILNESIINTHLEDVVLS